MYLNTAYINEIILLQNNSDIFFKLGSEKDEMILFQFGENKLKEEKVKIRVE